MKQRGRGMVGSRERGMVRTRGPERSGKAKEERKSPKILKSRAGRIIWASRGKTRRDDQKQKGGRKRYE